jgi:hypothetical protein
MPRQQALHCIRQRSSSNRVGDQYFGKDAEEGAKFLIVAFAIKNLTNRTQDVPILRRV